MIFQKKVVSWHNSPPAWGELCRGREYVGVNCAIDYWSKTEHFHLIYCNAISKQDKINTKWLIKGLFKKNKYSITGNQEPQQINKTSEMCPSAGCVPIWGVPILCLWFNYGMVMSLPMIYGMVTLSLIYGMVMSEWTGQTDGQTNRTENITSRLALLLRRR